MMLSRISRTGATIIYKSLPSLRCYSTQQPQEQRQKKKASPQTSITDEADFAFRKQEIEKLTFQSQDKLYYPLMKDLKLDLVDAQTIRIPEFRTKYQSFFKENPDVKKLEDEHYIINGKIRSIRRAGKGSLFIDLIQDYTKVQLVVNHKVMRLEKDEFSSIHGEFKPGDQITCIGSPGVTKVGELSLRIIKPIRLASPSLHPLPPKFTDPAKINGNRVVDYLVNERSKNVILTRSKIISVLRKFFEERGFIEVNTPIICSGNTGANANPFETSSLHLRDKDKNELKKLTLRVAPELWLKKLIISGFDKIFEVGSSFRNEGIDATHNPEFTTCEFYQTFIGLEDLMQTTECLILKIINELLNDSRLEFCHENCNKLLIEIQNNGGSFKRIDFISEIGKQTGKSLPQDLTSGSLIQYYDSLNLKIPEVRSELQLLDNLSSLYLEPLCKECPTFIYNLPESLSPLAKSSLSSDNQLVSNRFEMYINGKEYVNAYEEENNPFKQVEKFKSQLRAKDEFNDSESMIPDYKFTEFMEWGMPPTGGWGIGIDRLVMLLTGSDRIDSVLSFGKLTDVVKQ